MKSLCAVTVVEGITLKHLPKWKTTYKMNIEKIHQHIIHFVIGLFIQKTKVMLKSIRIFIPFILKTGELNIFLEERKFTIIYNRGLLHHINYQNLQNLHTNLTVTIILHLNGLDSFRSLGKRDKPVYQVILVAVFVYIVLYCCYWNIYLSIYLVLYLVKLAKIAENWSL